jgi:hypothetical protein
MRCELCRDTDLTLVGTTVHDMEGYQLPTAIPATCHALILTTDKKFDAWSTPHFGQGLWWHGIGGFQFLSLVGEPDRQLPDLLNKRPKIPVFLR